MSGHKKLVETGKKLEIINAYFKMIMNDYRLDDLDRKHIANLIKEDLEKTGKCIDCGKELFGDQKSFCSVCEVKAWEEFDKKVAQSE